MTSNNRHNKVECCNNKISSTTNYIILAILVQLFQHVHPELDTTIKRMVCRETSCNALLHRLFRVTGSTTLIEALDHMQYDTVWAEHNGDGSRWDGVEIGVGVLVSLHVSLNGT